jgi:hypothetical protein
MAMQRSILIAVIFIAATIVSGQAPSASEKSPRETLKRFCAMDAEGKQLSPEGVRELAAMFTRPAASRPDRAIVISKDFIVSNETMDGYRADFYVEYMELGQIDPSARFGPPPGPHHMRVLYRLVLTHTNRVAGPDDAIQKGVGEALEWKIEGSEREPRITAEAAVRYVSELRDMTSDSNIRKNAERTLSILRKLQ